MWREGGLHPKRKKEKTEAGVNKMEGEGWLNVHLFEITPWSKSQIGKEYPVTAPGGSNTHY